MRLCRSCALLFALLVLFPANSGLASSGRQPEVLIGAAASMAGLLSELKVAYEEANESRWLLHFASSGTLRLQIERGAPIDLFLSASEIHVEALVRSGLALGDPALLARNGLVLVRPHGAGWPTSFGDLAGIDRRRLGVGDPAHAPVGSYAKEALSMAGLWEAVEPRLVLALDARQLLQYVERGAVEAAIVYASDAARSEGAEVVEAVPPEFHPPVQYWMVAVNRERTPEEESALRAAWTFLQSEATRQALVAHGFGDPT